MSSPEVKAIQSRVTVLCVQVDTCGEERKERVSNTRRNRGNLYLQYAVFSPEVRAIQSKLTVLLCPS